MTTRPARQRNTKTAVPLLAATLLVATSAGCGLLAPLHELSSDAGTDESNAHETDGSGTTDPDPSDDLDASSNAEAAASEDADAAKDANGPFSCLNYLGALACDDFDDGAPSSGWTSSETNWAFDHVDVDLAASPSPARHIFSMSNEGLPKSVYTWDLATDGPHDAVCSFDFFSDLASSDVLPVRLFTFGLQSGADFWRVELVVQNGSVTANERTSSTTKVLAKSAVGSVPNGVVVPIVATFKISPTPHFTLEIANANVPATSAIAPTLNSGTLQATLGAAFLSQPTTAWSMRYDNFLCLEK